MANKPKRETKLKVKDLPKKEKALTKAEQKRVKGGKANFSGTWILSSNNSGQES
jgi:hypothetical protein